jgi:hypothetical protein
MSGFWDPVPELGVSCNARTQDTGKSVGRPSLVHMVDLELVGRLRDFGNSWRQVVEAHPEVRSHRDSRVKLSSATIRRAVADAKA